MPEAVIASTARTPIGKAYRGAFNNTHGAELGGHAIRHSVDRAGVEPGEVEDVLMGCAMPEGATGGNIARQCAIRGGLPVEVAGATVNRFCSSGMQAIAMAAQRVLVDRVPIMVAGGLESISLVQNEHANDFRAQDTWINEHKPELYFSMIQTAEVVADPRQQLATQLFWFAGPTLGCPKPGSHLVKCFSKPRQFIFADYLYAHVPPAFGDGECGPVHPLYLLGQSGREEVAERGGDAAGKDEKHSGQAQVVVAGKHETGGHKDVEKGKQAGESVTAK